MTRNPRLLVLATIACWSTGATLGRVISPVANFVLLAVAMSTCLITLAVYAAMSGIGGVRSTTEKFRVPYVIAGLFGYAIYWIGVTECYRSYGTASEPIVLNYLWPVMTVLFTELFMRRGVVRWDATRSVEAAGVLLGFVSMLLIATHGNLLALRIDNVSGMVWGLLAASSYGIFSAYSGTVSREDHAIFLVISCSASLVVLLVLGTTQLSEARSLTATDIAWAALLGVLSEGLGYIAWTKSNRLASELGVSISSIAALIYLLPLISLVIASFVFHETTILQPYFAGAVALVIISSVVCRRGPALIAMRARGR